MTQSQFQEILESLDALSPDQARELRRALERRRLAPPVSGDAGTEETMFDVATRAGLIGCIPGLPDSPPDLSTNPKHMEGFGGG